MGEPLTVPAGADDQAIEDATVELERRLARLEARALVLVGRGDADA